MYWYRTTCYDKRAAMLYDRHYSRAMLNKSSVGKRQITIARSLVLVTLDYSALWVTSWPNKDARNDGKDLWLNQIFRNESDIPSSALITEAVAMTRAAFWPALPAHSFTTYIDQRFTASEIAGYCYRRATPRWHRRGETSKGLAILELSPAQLAQVTPIEPQTFQRSLWEVAA